MTIPSLIPMRRWNTLLFLGVTAALALLNFNAFYPGYMGYDSMWQLYQARQGVYDDQHPPAMAMLWHLMLPLDDGPLPMLVFHLALYWGAIAILGLALIRQYPRLVYLLPALWLLPPLMGMSGVIWKDTGLCVSWLMAVALAMRYYILSRRPPRAVSAAMALCFLYGMAVRYNAVTGAWPLLFFMVALYSKPPTSLKAATHTAMISLALTIASYAAVTAGYRVASAFNLINSHRKLIIEQALYLEDLLCISERLKEPHFPSYMHKNTAEEFKKLMHEAKISPWSVSIWPWPPGYITDKPALVPELRSYWLHTIGQYPSDYLACRLHLANVLLRFGKEPFYTNLVPGNDPPVPPPAPPPPAKPRGFYAGGQFVKMPPFITGEVDEQFLDDDFFPPYDIGSPVAGGWAADLPPFIWDIGTTPTAGIVASYLDSMQYHRVNSPSFWAIFGAILLAIQVWFLWKKRKPYGPLALPILCLASSGLLYMGAYFIINLGMNVRFVYWSILAIALACALTLMQILGKQSRPESG